MADPVDKDGNPIVPNPIDQVKAEFARKTDNILAQIEKQNVQMQEALAAMTAAQNQRTQQPQNDPGKTIAEELEQLSMNNPAAYAARVAELATNQALAAQDRVNQAANQRRSAENKIIGELVTDYPELNDNTSELYRAAMKSYEKLSSQDKLNPLAMKSSIRDAAAELGVIPMKKRKVDDPDTFVAPGSMGGGRERTPRKEKLSQDTLAFAELLGRPVNDDNYRKSLEATAQRKSWTKYRGKGEV